jgi:hypothetical protein
MCACYILCTCLLLRQQTLCNEATQALAALYNTKASTSQPATVISVTSKHVTVLLGLPGSNVLTCAATILKLTSSSVQWQPVLLSFGSSDYSFADLVSAISTATASASGATAAKRVLLAVSSVHSAVTVATAAMYCGLTVGSVTACMAADQVYTESTADYNAIDGTQQWRQGLFEQVRYHYTSILHDNLCVHYAFSRCVQYCVSTCVRHAYST